MRVSYALTNRHLSSSICGTGPAYGQIAVCGSCGLGDQTGDHLTSKTAMNWMTTVSITLSLLTSGSFIHRIHAPIPT